MKNLLFILIWIILCLINANSQSDFQWFISNGIGKAGLNAEGTLNNYSVPINDQFTLNGIELCDPENEFARNDIFIIYDDGSHFNSRNEDFYFSQLTSATGILNHSFDADRNISYLYFTNRYEEDDLPNGVNLSAGTDRGGGSIHSVSVTIPEVLSANHDITFYNDITVIINYDLLVDRYGDREFILQYDGVEEISSGIRHNDNILDLEPVFSTPESTLEPYFPQDFVVPESATQVKLKSGSFSEFRYINFRPNKNIYSYGPDEKGEPQFYAVFTLLADGSPIEEQLKEEIRHSHDPNFIRVDSICQDDALNRHTIYYHLEFENNSMTAASTLAAQVSFPLGFDLNCLEATKWFAKDECSGYIKRTGRRVTFVFTGNEPISRCTTLDDSSCKGFVEFKVRTDESLSVPNVATNISLRKPLVYFDCVPFPIPKFIDLLGYSNGVWLRKLISIEGCTTFCKGYSPLVKGLYNCARDHKK